MSKKEVAEWLRDRIWPTLVRDSQSQQITEREWPSSLAVADETLELAYQALQDELKSEDERIKTVETKLLNISSLSPIAMTILVAMVTFLTSGRVQSFTRLSILVVAIFGGYITLQFLLAVRSAIKGLARRPFYRPRLEDRFPRGNESRTDYLRRACEETTNAITKNRIGIDDKVSQLALRHESILNAVWGLLIMVLILLAIVLTQPSPTMNAGPVM
jgi:hypothetical protein